MSDETHPLARLARRRKKKKVSAPACAPAPSKRKKPKKKKSAARQHTAATRKTTPKHKAPVCKPKKKKRHPAPVPAAPTPLAPAGGGPSTSQPAPITTPNPPPSGDAPPPPPPPPTPPAGTTVSSPIPKYTGTFGVAQAERLLWRAGFGPQPGQAQALAALGLDKAVASLTRPAGAAVLTGPAPVDSNGKPLAPYDLIGHDHAYWLDRMIRSNQQLVERLALVFHDWFATSFDGVNNLRFMLDQTNVFRRYGLGSFKDMVLAVSKDQAMIEWLDLEKSWAGQVNENYARELMELFTLGANRGAYTQEDVHEAARALTGWQGVWDDTLGWTSFYWDPAHHDTNPKTVFGQTGNFDWTDIARMVVEHPMHAGFFVAKLWSYFIPTPPSGAVQSTLEQTYVSSGWQIRPVLEAILCAPEFYEGPRMVKPPVVYHAGMMRARQRFINRGDWYWYTMMAGQRLYWPPDVSGWNDKRWLDTNTTRARWSLTAETFLGQTISSADWFSYDATETPGEAVQKALAFWASPQLGDAVMTELVNFAAGFDGTAALHAQRQNMLRQIIPCTPDYLTS